MSRFALFSAYFACAAALAAGAVVACGSGDENLEQNVTSSDAGTNIKRDSSLVDPVESGAPLDAGTLGPGPSCDKYCDLVTTNCTGNNAQYASRAECVELCKYLPLSEKTRTGAADDKEAASVACRQYWADSPAQTNPDAVCLAAGPFGGNACGDRCTAFCDVVLSACTGSNAPYADRGACAAACATFTYRDAGSDGGGEGPNGPDAGDSLNCRLWQLRRAVMNPEKCSYLQSETYGCKD